MSSDSNLASLESSSIFNRNLGMMEFDDSKDEIEDTKDNEDNHISDLEKRKQKAVNSNDSLKRDQILSETMESSIVNDEEMGFNGHEHDFGNRGTESAEFVRNWSMFFRALIFIHQVFHGYYLYFVLIPYHYKNDEFKSWAFRAILLVSVPLLVVTHCITSSTKSNTFNRARGKEYMNENEKIMYMTCKKCVDNEVWKPMRAKHCKTQQHDVSRFDHFCPVTLNTIGYRNHCIFIKTSVLHMLLSVIWLYMFVGYYFGVLLGKSKEATKGTDQSKQGVDEVVVLILWGIDILFVVLICCMSFGIACSHSSFCCLNATTLDSLGDAGNRPFSYRFGSFFFGIHNSMRSFTPSPQWLFFLPLPNNHKYEGYFFPQIGINKDLWFSKIDSSTQN